MGWGLFSKLLPHVQGCTPPPSSHPSVSLFTLNGRDHLELSGMSVEKVSKTSVYNERKEQKEGLLRRL